MSEDVVVGRPIVHRLRVELHGKLAKLFLPDFFAWR